MKIMRIWHFCEFCHFYPILDYHKINTEKELDNRHGKNSESQLKIRFTPNKIVPSCNGFDSSQSQNTLKSEHFPAMLNIKYYHLLSIRSVGRMSKSSKPNSS